MQSYFSLVYLWLFLPGVMLLYQLMPRKNRWIVLLGASYGFFWTFSQELIVYLLLSTASIYAVGRWMAAVQQKKKLALAAAEKAEKKQLKAAYQKKLRWLMLLGVLFNLAVLVVLKYSAFFCGNLNTLLEALDLQYRVEIPEFLLPLGISFYTMQAMSYLIDIYRGTLEADRNPGRLALYLSFFPQLMEGPICRYGETAQRLWAGDPITYENMTMGMQRILFGVMKKLVIADRLHPFVTAAFDNPSADGAVIILAMVSYTMELYMDFSGTMDLVIGTAEIFNVRLPENFTQPFFSKTVSEFWTRWHITLGAWFRDYIFYPVSMSRSLRKATGSIKQRFGSHAAAVLSGGVALFCVWIFNGLWHGAGWQYIFFGMYHFVLIFLGTIAEPLAAGLAEKWKIDRKALPYRIFQTLRTLVLVNIGELFFRADTLSKGMSMFRTMVSHVTMEELNWTFLANNSLDKRNAAVILLAVLLVLIVSILREKGIRVREAVARQNLVVRWAVYYLVMFMIILFGAYGIGHLPVLPIYAQF